MASSSAQLYFLWSRSKPARAGTLLPCSMRTGLRGPPLEPLRSRTKSLTISPAFAGIVDLCST
ncbi:hypothetical protein ADK96_22920 [Streptomyces sp. IGB124]|nr:hypothetical protein ADK96_22920 [Streptomyces sp. IGB124]